MVAGVLLAGGLRRAFREPARYRGCVVGGSIVAGIGLLLFGLFAAGTFFAARSLPPGNTALRVGQSAPDLPFSWPTSMGSRWSFRNCARIARCLTDFLPRLLVTALQLRVTEFPAAFWRFRERGVRIVAISVDSPEESKSLCRERGYTFPFLSDPQAATARAYGVLHAHGGENGQDIARPAEFLVDSAGTIRWENLTESLLARLTPGKALRAIDGQTH